MNLNEMQNDIINCTVFHASCREGSVDLVIKLVLLHDLESRGKHTTNGPGKFWKTTRDAVYEPGRMMPVG